MKRLAAARFCQSQCKNGLSSAVSVSKFSGRLNFSNKFRGFSCSLFNHSSKDVSNQLGHSEIKEYSDEEKNRLIDRLKHTNKLYKELTLLLSPAIKQFNADPTTQMDPKILQLMIDIVKNYRDNQIDIPADLLFLSSNVGMKLFATVKKVQLLLFKSLLQEWFDLEHYKPLYPGLKLESGNSGGVMDGLFVYNEFYESLMNSAAHCPTMNGYTKENLIGTVCYLFTYLKDLSSVNPDLLKFNDEVIATYAVIKERYLSASVMTNEDSFHYEAQKNYGYFLDKRYSEIEFDWYEDVETNIPLHLGSMMKILEAFSAFYNCDIVRAEQLLNESLKLCPNNPYAYYVFSSLKGSNTDLSNSKPFLDGISNGKKVLEILSKSIVLPIRYISCSNFEQSEVEAPKVKRENDFKISPIHFKIAMLNMLAAEYRGVTKEMRYLFAEKAVYSFTHAENYSRILHDGYFFYRKGLCYYFGDNYEQAACAFNAVQYFKHIVDRRKVIESIVKSSNCMVKLGYAEHCLPVLDKLIEEYHQDPHLLLQKIYCSDICAKSKDELRNIVKEYKQLAENLRNKMKEEPQYREYMSCVDFSESRSELLEKDISNPKLAESW